MAFFPDSVMPKTLKRETSSEVDDSPLIYNARDYNIHHREIRAIEEFLIGPPSSSSNSGSGSESTTVTAESVQRSSQSVSGKVDEISNLMLRISNGGLLSQHTGTVRAGDTVPVPSSVVKTNTSGEVLSSATTINVDSTAGFPSSGTLTKFNSIDPTTICSNDGGPPGVDDRCDSGSVKMVGFDLSANHVTNQEVITYTSKTATSFLGCTREVNGSTSQDSGADSPALIVSGNASVAVSHNLWARRGTNTPNQFYVTHDSQLRTEAKLLREGSRTSLKDPIQEQIEVGYVLTVVGGYEDVVVGDSFGSSEE